MDPPNPYRCATHPDREAGWRCERCDRELCPDCTASVITQTAVSSYEVCARCDGVVRQLTITGAPFDAPFRMAETFRVPVGIFSLVLVVALFLCLRGLSRIDLVSVGIPLAVVQGLIFWAAFFTVVHASARATDELKAAVSVEAREFILLPSLRTSVWSAVWFCPLLLVQHLRGLAVERWLTDPLAWLWCLSVSALAPAALVRLASGAGVGEALSPHRLRETIRRIGGDYRVAAALTVGAGGFSFVLLVTCDYASKRGLDDVTPAFLRTFALYAQLLTARVVGLLLDVRGFAVGYPLAPTRQVPAMPDARPTGTRMARPEEAPNQQLARREVTLEPERFEGELTPAQRVDLVLAALRENDLDGAIARYAELPESVDGWLSVRSQLTLGQAAVARGQLPLAVRALKQAAVRVPDDPLAPRACILLARLYGERLGDAESAGKLYRHVVQRYPGSEAARFARARLATP